MSLYTTTRLFLQTGENLIGFTANDYYLFSYDSENGLVFLIAGADL